MRTVEQLSSIACMDPYDFVSCLMVLNDIDAILPSDEAFDEIFSLISDAIEKEANL